MSSGLKQRVTTAILIGIPILFLVFFNNTTRLIFLALIAIFANLEYLLFFYKKASDKKFIILSYLLGIALIGASIIYPDKFFFISLVALIFSIIFLWDLFYNKSLIHYQAPWLFAVVYISMPIASLASFHTSENFYLLLISILLIIWISDIGAYFVGRSMGKRKLFERISPGKTWEGFWGAGTLCVLSSYIFSTVFDAFTLQTWALIALSCWLFGSLGDLVESKIKRAVKVKDSANFLPGHGGFLDRFDGFIFCLPFVCSLVIIVQKFI